MDAREIESLSMLSRGFAELKEANPELAYNVILDILSGINEYITVAYSTASLLIVHCPAIPRCASMFKLHAVYSLTNASFARAR